MATGNSFPRCVAARNVTPHETWKNVNYYSLRAFYTVSRLLWIIFRAAHVLGHVNSIQLAEPADRRPTQPSTRNESTVTPRRTGLQSHESLQEKVQYRCAAGGSSTRFNIQWKSERCSLRFPSKNPKQKRNQFFRKSERANKTSSSSNNIASYVYTKHIWFIHNWKSCAFICIVDKL